MKEYEPELGQMAGGQPWQQFKASEMLVAALRAIEAELGRVIWNETQTEYASPFCNTGNRFDCPTFSAHAYSWGDDDQPFNFKWRDIEVSWYKYLGRGTTVNRRVTPDEIERMLDDCLTAVLLYETDLNNKTEDE